MYSKNRVALTPPLGWNSYDYYDTTVTEEEVKENADYMAANLKSYGYEYIVVDIQWSDPYAGTDRKNQQYINFSLFCLDEFGRQIPAPNRFPSSKNGAGFAPLADYIHGLGLKFGIHIMRGIPRFAAHNHLPIKGTTTTADKIANPYSLSRWNADMYGVDYQKPGALEYYNSIFELYASWGVDFVKVDDICNTNFYEVNPYSAQKEIELIYHAIKSCGRKMVLSLSPGPAVIEKAWHLKKFANMWRITDDFWDNWQLLKNMFERCEVWQRQVSEGCYPDCDMLPIGHLGKGFGEERISNFTLEEIKTMLTLWSIFRSPLMIGGNLTKFTNDELALLTNDEILHLITHAYGAAQIRRNSLEAVWCSFDSVSEAKYLAFFNLSEEERTIEVTIEELLRTIENNECKNGISSQADISKVFLSLQVNPQKTYSVRDLWAKKDCGSISGELECTLPAHGACVYRLL